MVLTLLKKGIPYDVINSLDENQVTVVLAIEQALAEREAEEQAKQQSQSMRF